MSDSRIPAALQSKGRSILMQRFLITVVAITAALAFSAFVNREPALPHLPFKYSEAVNAALNKSGENRGELVRALAGISRDRLPAMCDIISRMPNYDLTHMTSAMLIDHVNTTFESLSKVPWKTPSTSSQVFLDYVLPHRVYCERLDNSRAALFTHTLPAVQSCTTPGQAVEAMIKLCDNPVVVKEYMGSAFPYDYTPMDGWQRGFVANNYWNCRARTIVLVAMLRSVGIPACVVDRLASSAFGSSHACFLWYDTSRATWRIHGPDLGAADEAIKAFYQQCHEVMDYTVPPYPSADYLSRHQFDKMNRINTFTLPHGTLTVQAEINGAPAAGAVVGVYTWNFHTQNWYNVVIDKTNQSGQLVLPLGFNNKYRPYLISVSKGKKSGFGFVLLSAESNSSEFLRLSLTDELKGYPQLTRLDVKATAENPQ